VRDCSFEEFQRGNRYSKVFTTIEPTLFNVCEYWFLKDQNRVRDLRVDSLSQVLNLANIRPGGKYLAVDDASGLLVAGILERLGGKPFESVSFSRFTSNLFNIRPGKTAHDLQL